MATVNTSRAVATRPQARTIQQYDPQADLDAIQRSWDYLEKGDLKSLAVAERARLYVDLCRSLGLDPRMRPLSIVESNGKLSLYISKGATDAIAEKQRLSRTIVERAEIVTLDGEKMITLRVEVSNPQGRRESEVYYRAVQKTGYKNELAVQLLKAQSAAKRRLTLAFLPGNTANLWLEDDIETVEGAQAQPLESYVKAEAIDTAAATPASAQPDIIDGEVSELQPSTDDFDFRNPDDRQKQDVDVIQFFARFHISASEIEEYTKLMATTKKGTVTSEDLYTEIGQGWGKNLVGIFAYHLKKHAGRQLAFNEIKQAIGDAGYPNGDEAELCAAFIQHMPALLDQLAIKG